LGKPPFSRSALFTSVKVYLVPNGYYTGCLKGWSAPVVKVNNT